MEHKDFSAGFEDSTLRTMDLFILAVLWMDLSYTDLFRLDKTTHGITRMDFRSFLIA
jgi:hypothetical protein